VRSLVWFRGKDLRLHDHEPLRAALSTGEIVLLFVIDPHFFAPDRAKQLAHRMQFLLESLAALTEAIEAAGSRLVLVAGRSVEVVPRLARAWRCDRVVAHRWTEPFGRERDRRVAAALDPIPLQLFEGETLAPPGSLRTAAGGPFTVFTPFARAFRDRIVVAAPLPRPARLPPPPADLAFEAVSLPLPGELGLRPNPSLPRGGEREARARLRRFLASGLARYAASRDDLGDEAGSSRLSADLKFGTVSVRAVHRAAAAAAAADPRAKDGAAAFLRELLWRDFAYATLAARPDVLDRPFRPEFEGFPWRRDRDAWRAWAEGLTGYPVVDAAARQLLAEGFVPNRARMIAASFLTKHLLIDLREGERHYLAHLVDGDWANNDLGWQWSAGCGCDAQPWFRIFHPVLQGRRHDPKGTWVRRWVPELVRLPDRWIHAPWEAPDEILRCAGVELGRTYPGPIVDHAMARARFLAVAREHLGRAGRGG
jgi:deoxyribodipyrimidine photo-lyase